MNKCLKILIYGSLNDSFFNKLQKKAQKDRIEGIVQADPEQIKVIACGNKESIDDLLDFIHKESSDYNVEDIEVEAHIKDKDYRGVFRVIS